MIINLTNRSARKTAILSWAGAVFAILAARVFSNSELAATYPHISAIIFLWVVADALALSMMARATRFAPGIRPLLGAVAAACVIAPIGAAAPVRAALFEMPPLLIAMGFTIALYLGWSGTKAIAVYRYHRVRDTSPLIAAFSEILPPALVKYLSTELGMIRLALLRWNAPADIPAGSRAFFYHQYLVPMLIVFLVLQLIELVVVHFLVSLWSEKAALVLSAISIWGVIYIVALIKSLRINPVLLSDVGIRIRAGNVIDKFILFEAIGTIETSVSSEQAKDKTTLNAAIFSHPNIILKLKQPISRRTFFGKTSKVQAIALKLDEPSEFLRVVSYRTA